MTEKSTITSRVTMTRPAGATRTIQNHATAFVGVVGAIQIPEAEYHWPGLAGQDVVATLLFYARWAVGRQLANVLNAPAPAGTANQTADGWVTTFVWEVEDKLPVTVTVPSFGSFSQAEDAARAAIEAFIPTLVPGKDDIKRISPIARLVASPPSWVQQINQSAAIYP